MSFGTNAPQGLNPVRYRDGSPWNGATNQYSITSGYNTSVFTNDPVATLSDGTIGIGVAGSPCRGIFQGCKFMTPLNTFTFSPYWPANQTVATGTTPIAMIADTPNLVFSVQETDASGNAGTPLALADRNLNINFRIGSGVTASGMSTTSINNASENTTPTLNLKILDLDPTPGNVVGAYANWLCSWNNQDFLSGGTTGV